MPIEDGRIVRIGGTPPAGAEVIDCSGGMTVVLGLMDAHVHLGLCTDFTRMLTDEQSPAELAADIFATRRDTLDAGFTTVRDTIDPRQCSPHERCRCSRLA